MNGCIDTTVSYVKIYSCYGEQLKYLFFDSLYPFAQEMLNTQTSDL